MSDERITLSVAEVAKATGVSEQSVRRSIKSGQMPAIRLGSRVLILAQPFLDTILVALGDPDAVKDKREDDAAQAEVRRLSHTGQSKDEWLSRLTKLERADYDERTAIARADRARSEGESVLVRYA
jgi:excisionase family DNA binding protein